MKISFSPVRSDQRLVLERRGDVLVFNGDALDLSGIPEGATLPQAAAGCDWIASDIERRGGILHLTLILPHGAQAAEATLFPAPITVTGDGPVTLPDYALPVLEDMSEEAL
jgi:hypothetical protein